MRHAPPVKSEVYDTNYYNGMGGFNRFETQNCENSPYGHTVAFMSRFINLEDAHILDIGCGRGDPLFYLSNQIKNGVGFDYSKAATDIGKISADKKITLPFLKEILPFSTRNLKIISLLCV